MKYDKIRDRIVELCAKSVTFSQVEASLGLSSPNPALRKYIKTNSFPMPLYEGKRAAYKFASVGKNRVTIADLREKSVRSIGSIKAFLFRNQLKQPKCEECGWNKSRSDGTIPVELHHLNGDNSDNRLENLKILCPCCHSLTENFSGKNRFNPVRALLQQQRQIYYADPKIECSVCGKLGYGEKYCSSACQAVGMRKSIRPAKEILSQEILVFSWSALGDKYGVSDNAVRKWAKRYGLLPQQ